MIAEMKKVQITGLLSERRKIVREMQRLGVLQVEAVDILPEDSENVLAMAQFDQVAERMLALDSELSKVRDTMKFLEEVDRFKGKSGKSPKPILERSDFASEKMYHGVWEKIFAVNRLKSEIEELRLEQNVIKNKITALMPWVDMDMPLETRGTKKTLVLKGAFPASADLEKIKTRLLEFEYCKVLEVGRDRDQIYVAVFAHNSISEDVGNYLKEIGFSEADFHDLTGSVIKNIARYEKERDTLQKKIEHIEIAIVKHMGDLPQMKKMYDYLLNSKERKVVRSKILQTDTAFLLGGFVAEENFERFKEAMQKQFMVVVQEVPIGEDESAPILLRNSKLVAPFESITKMYSMPNSHEADPNLWVAVFYFLFFGMMLSDAAYGLLLMLGTFVMLKKLKPSGMMEKTLKLMFLCGISTIFWGAAFGGWFGNFAATVFGDESWIARMLSPFLFDPLANPIGMIGLSCAFGAVHIVVGMGMNAYLLIKSGKVWDAVFDVFFWYAVFAGILMLILGGSFVEIGKYTALAGVVGLILTQGRAKKGIFNKLISGVLSLYGITGYFSDILSYTRVLALCLSTGVIAMVVNIMGTMAGVDNVVGLLLLAVVFVLGHGFNLAMSLLGAYVHTSRLQYVEFFGKFYSGGGKEFMPFKVKNQYTALKQ